VSTGFTENFKENSDIQKYTELDLLKDPSGNLIINEVEGIKETVINSNSTSELVDNLSSSLYYNLVEQFIKLYQVFFKNYDYNFLDSYTDTSFTETLNSGFMGTIIVLTALILPGSLLLLATVVSKTNSLYKIMVTGILGFLSFSVIFVVKQDLILLGLLLGLCSLLTIVLSFSVFRVIFSISMGIFSIFSAKYFYETSIFFTSSILPQSSLLVSFEPQVALQVLLTLIIVTPLVFTVIAGVLPNKTN
jgi:hypothetical protein